MTVAPASVASELLLFESRGRTGDGRDGGGPGWTSLGSARALLIVAASWMLALRFMPLDRVCAVEAMDVSAVARTLCAIGLASRARAPGSF